MPLVDTGLICRYYMDEGTGTTVADASGNAYDLQVQGTGLVWTTVSGNTGLESTSLTGTQRARRSIDNTTDALRDALTGTAVATIEMVIDVQNGNSSTGRVFAINDRVGGSPVFGFTVTNTSFRTYWNGAALGDTNINSSRHVLHIVIDTTLGSNQYKVYLDGSVLFQGPTSGTLTIGSNVDLICFNRESSGSFDRSFDGVLFYAAMYDVAFSAADVTNNFDILTLDDDSPGAAPVAYVTPITHPLTRTTSRM